MCLPVFRNQNRTGLIFGIGGAPEALAALISRKAQRDTSASRVRVVWVLEAKKRFGLSVLNYIVTSNHIHLLVKDTSPNVIADSMQLIAGRTGQQYNQRKRRHGAFWEDRYHATAIEADEHLYRCLVYIDLNMVRAGMVTHPAEWPHSGYREIQNRPKRYGIIDLRQLSALCGFSEVADFQRAHRDWVDEALKRYPDDANLHFDLGIVLERTNDLVGTQREFERAAKLGADSAEIQGWVARFFWKRKQDPRRALNFYLNAYFLDPEFYETEYVTSRIPRVARETVAMLKAESRKNSSNGGNGSAELDSLSPLLEETRLGAEKEHWSANSMDKVLEIMGSDDEGNRWDAMQLAALHLNEISDDRLTRLLEEPDLRKRGLAGYLAVQRWHEKALPVMKTWLQDPAELVRYDAISALGIYGDAAGRKLVEEYLASGKEPNARMREFIEQALAKTNDGKQR